MYAGIHASDYDESFSKLQNFIDLSLDEVKTELSKVLFPVFVCLFLNMIMKAFNDEAKQFFQKHKGQFLPSHKADISILETVQDLQRLEDPEVSKYIKNKFFVKISRHSYTLLKYQVDFNQLNLILHIMNLNI
jgi:transcription initiation factor TFIID subunit 5